MSLRNRGAAASAGTDLVTLAEVQALIAAAGGGGGASGLPQFWAPTVGDWLAQAAAGMDAGSIPNAEMRLSPMFLPAGTYDAVAFQLNSAGSAGAVAKVVVYADAATPGRPGSLLIDTATVDCSTGGLKQITGLSLVAPAGGRLVWAGTVTQGAPSTLPTFWRVSRSSLPTVYNSGTLAVLYANVSTVLTTTGVTGAAPATPSMNFGDTHTRLAFRRSA